MANAAVTFIGCYWSSTSQTTLAAATPAKAAGTTTAFAVNNGFTHASNKLTYNGATTRTFKVTAAISAETTGADTAKFHLYKNAALITGATVTREVSNNDIGAVCISCVVSLAEDDYVELYVETAGGADMTVNDGSLIAEVLG